MPRSNLAATAAAWAALLFIGCSGEAEQAANEPPIDPATLPMQYRDHNVILVSFDALQARHVGCLGYERDVTPTLDALAAESFTFRRAYSVASWTVPATMTWFTGVYPSEHGLTNKFAVYTAAEQRQARLKDMSPQLVTLAQVLKENGYATAGFTGNAGVSGSFGYDQGFDVYSHEKQRFGSFDRSVPEAVKWLKANKERKFFLFLHGYDVHGQCEPAGGFDYRFVDADYDGRYSGSPQEQELLREEGLDNGELTLRDADVRFWRAIYDEKIQRADAKFADFLRELDKLGLADKTLLIVTSDHGTEFYEHRRFDHGFTLYDEQIHVPLFIRLPGQRSNKVIADRVSSIDLMPTILDLLGIQATANLQEQLRGESLASAMRGEPQSRDIISETDYREYTYKRSLIAPDGWKLIYTLNGRTRELFDLNRDPDETNNLAGSQPGIADELEERLFAHYESIGHDLRGRGWETGMNPVYDFPSRPDPPQKSK
jgi:arylsulfatase A-like enzyme